MESELTEKLHSISYRATKAECLDLPETTDMIRQIELEPAALRIYRGLVKESYAELAGGEVTATNILTRLLRLSQLTGGVHLHTLSCPDETAYEHLLQLLRQRGFLVE